MELSKKLFAEIVGASADAAFAHGVGHERRRHGRVAIGSRAKIFPLMESTGGEGCSVLVRDISRAGMGFLLDEPMAVGDEFVIHVPRPAAEPIQIHSMVSRCELGGTGRTQFVIGATFELVLNSTEPLTMPSEEPEENADATGEGSNCASASAGGAGEVSSQSAEDLYDRCITCLPAPELIPPARSKGLLGRICAVKPIRIPVTLVASVIHGVASVMRWLMSPFTKLTNAFSGMMERHSASSSRIRNRLRPTKMAKGAKTPAEPSRLKKLAAAQASRAREQGPVPVSVVESVAAQAVGESVSGESGSGVSASVGSAAGNSGAGTGVAAGHSRKSLFAAAVSAVEPTETAVATAVEAQQPVPAILPSAVALSAAVIVEAPVAVTAGAPAPASERTRVNAPRAEEVPPATPIQPEQPAVLAPVPPAAAPIEAQTPMPVAVPVPLPVEFPAQSPVPGPEVDPVTPKLEKPGVTKPGVPVGSRIGLHTAYARHPRRRSGR